MRKRTSSPRSTNHKRRPVMVRRAVYRHAGDDDRRHPRPSGLAKQPAWHSLLWRLLAEVKCRRGLVGRLAVSGPIYAASGARSDPGRIVTAAANSFATRGYAPTTLAKIAAARRCSAERPPSCTGGVRTRAPDRQVRSYVAFGVPAVGENILDMELGRRSRPASTSSEGGHPTVTSEQTEVPPAQRRPLLNSEP